MTNYAIESEGQPNSGPLFQGNSESEKIYLLDDPKKSSWGLPLYLKCVDSTEY